MFEVRYYFGGFRVCVRWLPVRGNITRLINWSVACALAEFTYLAIGPVNTNPTCNFIPKNEIIWHMRSPTFAYRRAKAYQQCTGGQRGPKPLPDMIGNAVMSCLVKRDTTRVQALDLQIRG